MGFKVGHETTLTDSEREIKKIELKEFFEQQDLENRAKPQKSKLVKLIEFIQQSNQISDTLGQTTSSRQLAKTDEPFH